MTANETPVAKRQPPLARSALNRAAHHRTDPAWLEAAWDRARILVVSADSRALAADGHLVLLGATDVPVGSADPPVGARYRLNGACAPSLTTAATRRARAPAATR